MIDKVKNSLVTVQSLQSYLAFLCVTLVLSGHITAKNLSQEIADNVITLDTMHKTVIKNNSL